MLFIIIIINITHQFDGKLMCRNLVERRRRWRGGRGKGLETEGGWGGGCEGKGSVGTGQR